MRRSPDRHEPEEIDVSGDAANHLSQLRPGALEARRIGRLQGQPCGPRRRTDIEGAALENVRLNSVKEDMSQDRVRARISTH